MYNRTLGQSLNYGQSFVPGRQSGGASGGQGGNQGGGQEDFLSYQTSVYDGDGEDEQQRRRRQGQSQVPQQSPGLPGQQPLTAVPPMAEQQGGFQFHQPQQQQQSDLQPQGQQNDWQPPRSSQSSGNSTGNQQNDWQPPQASTPFMPNGAPQIQPQPQPQPQQATGGNDHPGQPLGMATPAQQEETNRRNRENAERDRVRRDTSQDTGGQRQFNAAQQTDRPAPNGQGGGQRSGVFDSAAYLRMYPDVAAAGMDAEAHYNTYGRNEGRQSMYTDTPTPPPAQAPQSGGPDPFAAMGGGVRLANGSWVPRNHPLAQQQGQQPPRMTGGVDSAPAGPTNPANSAGGPDPFTAMGGGVQLPNGDWVPRDHPLAQTPGAAGGGGPRNMPPTGGIDPAGAQPPEWTAQYNPTQFNPLTPLGPVTAPGGITAPTSQLPAQSNWWQQQLLGNVNAPGGVTTPPSQLPAETDWWRDQLIGNSAAPTPVSTQSPIAQPGGNWWEAQGIRVGGAGANEDTPLDMRGVYTPRNMPGGLDYNAQNIAAFNGPDMGGVDQQQRGLLQQLLANPESMGQRQISQLKGSARDSALAMQEQLLGSTRDSLAARGIDPTLAGYGENLQRSIKSGTTRGLLDSYRNIDTQAVATNRNDLLNAIGAGENFKAGEFNRALGGYEAGLAGSAANREEQMAGIDSRYRNFTTQEDMNARGSDSLRAAIGDQRDQSNFNATRNDSNRRSDMDFLSNQRQSDRDYDVQNRDLASQDARFNATNAFNYTDMNNRNQQFNLGFQGDMRQNAQNNDFRNRDLQSQTDRFNAGQQFDYAGLNSENQRFNLGFQSDQMQNDRDFDFRNRSLQSETDRFNAGQQFDYANMNNDNARFNQTQQTERDRMTQNDNQFGAQFGADRDRFNQGNYQFGQTQGLDRDRMALQNQQFGQSLGLDRDRLNSSNQQWDRNFGFQQEQFNYGREQDALSNQRASDAQSAAQSRWEEEQLMNLYNQQNGGDEELWNWLMGGGQ